jgi:hypothetical protein
VGYVYSTVALKPIVSRLPIPDTPVQTHDGHGEEWAFRKLENNWYLFYQVAW